eukprot:Gb_37906 [translate_table: standard]
MRSLSMDGTFVFNPAASCQNWGFFNLPRIGSFDTVQSHRLITLNLQRWNSWSRSGNFRFVTDNTLHRHDGFRGVVMLGFQGFKTSFFTPRANSVGVSGNVEWEGTVAKLEGNVSLEKEIFEFMQASGKPDDFPTKGDLLRAGRSDLVNAIIAEGGWLTAGWDLDEPDAEIADCEDSIDTEDLIVSDDDDYVAEDEPESYLHGHFQGTPSPQYEEYQQNTARANTIQMGYNDCKTGLSRHSTGDHTLEKPSSGETIDISAEKLPEIPGRIEAEETGITGMLNRLERERILSYSEASAGKKGKDSKHPDERRESWDRVAKIFGTRSIQSSSVNGKRKDDVGSVGLKASQDTSHSLGRDAVQGTDENTDLDSGANMVKPYAWRTPSLQQMENFGIETKGEQGDSHSIWQRQRRIGQQVSSQSMQADDKMNIVVDKINEIIDSREEWMLDVKTSYSGHSHRVSPRDVPNTILSRIRSLEFQLASTLGSLRSEEETLDTMKDHKSPLEELEEASDALEFRETEIMNTRAKLRSTRAKLAALEGKMAMEIMEVRKVIEEKEQKLQEAQKVLNLMRIARIVWPNSGSEVLLAGSFDGWTSRRKMLKSSAGVFVVSLHLYPGRYEIKFIVDGIWRVDPQRPVVYNNGFENNLLLIY